MSNAMTNEEAIRILDPDCKEVWKAYDGKDMERCNEACRVAVKALKKQMPKKPNYPNEYKIRCPICDTPVIDGQPYCDECGQALDWSD